MEQPILNALYLGPVPITAQQYLFSQQNNREHEKTGPKIKNTHHLNLNVLQYCNRTESMSTMVFIVFILWLCFACFRLGGFSMYLCVFETRENEGVRSEIQIFKFKKVLKQGKGTCIL